MDESADDQQSTQISPQTSERGGHPPQPDPDEPHTLRGEDQA